MLIEILDFSLFVDDFFFNLQIWPYLTAVILVLSYLQLYFKPRTKLNSLWSPAQGILPKNIFNFAIEYIDNTLPAKKNLCIWGLASTYYCSFCLKPESLLHVIAGCTIYLNDGHFIS